MTALDRVRAPTETRLALDAVELGKAPDLKDLEAMLKAWDALAELHPAHRAAVMQRFCKLCGDLEPFDERTCQCWNG